MQRVRWFMIIFTAALCLASVGCGRLRGDQGPSEPTDGDAAASRTVHELTVDGLTRRYRLYLPANRAPVAPLVLMLHGGLGDAAQAEGAYGWNEQADRAGFVVAYPDGVGRTWNAGTCCGRSQRDGVDDVAFLNAVIDDVRTRVGVDSARIFMTGMSNGALMSYRFACSTDRLAAIGPVAGTLVTACPATARPLSVMHVHGLADDSVRFDGRPGSGVGRVDGDPVPDVIAFWRRAADCAAPLTQSVAGVETSVATCPHGREVRLVIISGGGHQWPDPRSGGSFDTTRALWDFFSAHPG